MDVRVQKLARVLVNYSLKVKKGQLFRIEGELVTLPLIKAVYEEAKGSMRLSLDRTISLSLSLSSLNFCTLSDIFFSK